MNSLVGKRSRKAIKTALRTLQTDSKASEHDKVKALDQAYEQAMKRIQAQVADSYILAKQVLSWITCARRPLTTLELRDALAVEMNESELDQDNLPDIEDMVSACAGLVTIDLQGDIIRLVHYTAQEYFERTQHSWFPNAHDDITMTCVTYLSFDAFETGFCPADEDYEDRLQLNPLYIYAARNWGHHAQVASPEVDPLIMSFLESAAKVSASSQALMAAYFPLVQSGFSQRMPRGVEGVHLCAYFGLERVMTLLLKSSHTLFLRDAHDRTPLAWAAEQGHEPIVKLLLSMDGVEVNAADRNGWKPLFLAAMRRHKSVVKILLATESINTGFENEFGLTLLRLTAAHGEILAPTMVAVVCNMQQDLITTEGQMWAVREQYELSMKRYIEKHKIDLNMKDEWGRTLLSHAAELGLTMVVKLLCSTHTVRRSIADRYGRTPIWWASRKGHPTVVRLLSEILEVYENGVGIRENGRMMATPSEAVLEGHVICDVCISEIPNASIHYHCGICTNGDFDMCQECVASGAACLDQSHNLVKRTFEDGHLVELSDDVGSCQP
jgi:ankyrin repeat protein